MAYVFACILGLLAAGQASIIPNGLSAYNTPLLHYGTGIPLAPGALNLYGPSVGPSSVSYSLPINKQYIHTAPVAVAPAVAAYAAPVAHVAPAVAAYAAPVAHVAAPVAAYAAPVAHVAAPVAAIAPVIAPALISADVSSQYHAQDELGQYSFGYSNKDQTRNEERDAYGRVTGSYSYVDEYGRVNQQSYIADEGGFRVTGNNLPVHHLGKRSLYSGAYPASTGPLAHGYHNIGAVAHPGYHVAPEIRTVHHVAAPVHHVVKPVHHVVKPATYAVRPIAYANKPVAHVAAPVHRVVKPVTYAAKPVVHVAKPVAYAPNPLAYAIKAPVHVAHVAGYAVPKKVSYAAARGTATVYG